jgi:hypothetical protein
MVGGESKLSLAIAKRALCLRFSNSGNAGISPGKLAASKVRLAYPKSQRI